MLTPAFFLPKLQKIYQRVKNLIAVVSYFQCQSKFKKKM